MKSWNHLLRVTGLAALGMLWLSVGPTLVCAQTEATPAKSDIATSGPGRQPETNETARKDGKSKTVELRGSESKSHQDKESGRSDSARAASDTGSPAKQNEGAGEPSRKPASASRVKAEVAAKSGVKAVELNAERERAGLDFATRHHPELAALIAPLKSSNPREYQRAVRELFRTSERLAAIRLKDPARYELELDAWKLQSQIRLLAARLTMATDPDLETHLRETLKKKSETQLKLLQNERDSLRSRLEQVQKDIDQKTQSQEQLVQQEYDRLMKKSARDKTAVNKVPGARKGTPPKGPAATR